MAGAHYEVIMFVTTPLFGAATAHHMTCKHKLTLVHTTKHKIIFTCVCVFWFTIFSFSVATPCQLLQLCFHKNEKRIKTIENLLKL